MSTPLVGTAPRRFARLLMTGAIVLAACSGGGEATTGSTGAVTTQETTATSEPASPALETGTTEPESDPDKEPLSPLAELFEAALGLDAATSAVETGRILGSPDLATAAAIADFMTERGEDLTGVETWVLPIVETGTSLLVFDIVGEADGFFADGAGDDSSDEDADALLEMPWFQDANIVETVLILHLEDEEGPMTVTLSFPIDELGETVDLDETSIPMQIDRGS